MPELPSEKERLQQRIDRKQAELTAFQDSSQVQIDERLAELADGIEQTTPHETGSDERSMHEHLTKLKAGLERDPDAWVQYRIDEIQTEINRLEQELNNL